MVAIYFHLFNFPVDTQLTVFNYVIDFIYKEDRIYKLFFFFQAEDGIRDRNVTGVQTCALPIVALLETLDVASDLLDNRTVLMSDGERIGGEDLVGWVVVQQDEAEVAPAKAGEDISQFQPPWTPYPGLRHVPVFDHRSRSVEFLLAYPSRNLRVCPLRYSEVELYSLQYFHPFHIDKLPLT